jgi:hypothetical protein
MTLLESSIYVHRPFPVEFVVRAGDTPLRVAVDWEDLERWMGPASSDANRVRGFLHDHRNELGVVIEARLAARGIPLGRQLMLSAEDLRDLVPAPEPPPEPRQRRQS